MPMECGVMANECAALDIMLSRLESVVQRLEMLGSECPEKASSSSFKQTDTVPMDKPRMLEDFDNNVLCSVQQFNGTCSSMGDVVKQLGNLVEQTFQAHRDFILNAGCMKKPDGQHKIDAMLQPTGAAIQSIQNYKERADRSSPFFNHLSAVSESIPAVGWVTVAPAPAPFVGEMIDSAQFYLNRILKEFKDKDAVHKQFVQQWSQVLSNLKTFVKQYHTVGFAWNSLPAQAKPAAATPSSMASGRAGALLPPPPPPPPPPSVLMEMSPSQDEASGGQEDARRALFAEINKGLDITKGLKKVTADMQTHKNPTLRQASPMQPKPTVAAKPPHLSARGSSPRQQQQQQEVQSKAVFECQGGKKWMIEYQTDATLVVDISDMKQVVYIYKCVNTTVQIKGKLNSITLDACKKTKVVFDDLVSSVEVINCQKMELQTLGTLPTVTIQKSDGCLLYLSRKALDCEIVSSRSSEMNVLVPDENGEFQEHSIPEQFKTVWTGKRFESRPTEAA